VRAAMQLRSMLAEMGMSSIPSMLPFPKAHELLDEEGRPTVTALAPERLVSSTSWSGTPKLSGRPGNEELPTEQAATRPFASWMCIPTTVPGVLPGFLAFFSRMATHGCIVFCWFGRDRS